MFGWESFAAIRASWRNMSTKSLFSERCGSIRLRTTFFSQPSGPDQLAELVLSPRLLLGAGIAVARACRMGGEVAHHVLGRNVERQQVKPRHQLRRRLRLERVPTVRTGAGG